MQEAVYSVSQAVKLLEVQSHVLRYWEEEMHLPIERNEMGHRYYTRSDIQVFLSIKELKKKGYSLKQIGELTAFLYKESSSEDEPVKIVRKPRKTEQKKERIPSEFMDIISRIVSERTKPKSPEEIRYMKLDERIRNCQQSRREIAAAAEEKRKKKRFFKK